MKELEKKLLVILEQERKKSTKEYEVQELNEIDFSDKELVQDIILNPKLYNFSNEFEVRNMDFIDDKDIGFFVINLFNNVKKLSG
jgi:hypothetical protein